MDVPLHDKTPKSPHVMACAVKPVYKGHSTFPENVILNEQFPFIYRFKIYALFINGKHETVHLICHKDVPLNACLTVIPDCIEN